ncbi:uncharacterized protein BXIN_0477 [Babesia sp. Xinjiang]|uniref:uncharacterized protein n=1 Tax=Babesia sp. Xinjiang TaxID=462227 RepID=UPI000A227F8A|nr:uncharacterized protein BXIN_0477 [Babesia sp. Xinjiang]ORM41916.1 hypothetical protein BXIN_0477 [Babesia sp. Xinjiang]
MTVHRRLFSVSPLINDDVILHRKRLMMRVKNTGMKELDVLFDGYISSISEEMSPTMLDEFDALLDIETPSLYQALVVRQKMPEQLQGNLVAANILDYVKRGLSTAKGE